MKYHLIIYNLLHERLIYKNKKFPLLGTIIVNVIQYSHNIYFLGFQLGWTSIVSIFNLGAFFKVGKRMWNLLIIFLFKGKKKINYDRIGIFLTILGGASLPPPPPSSYGGIMSWSCLEGFFFLKHLLYVTFTITLLKKKN